MECSENLFKVSLRSVTYQQETYNVISDSNQYPLGELRHLTITLSLFYECGGTIEMGCRRDS